MNKSRRYRYLILSFMMIFAIFLISSCNKGDNIGNTNASDTADKETEEIIKTEITSETAAKEDTPNEPKKEERDMLRPYFHYTPEKNMLSDPNGLVYNAKTGEWHLYHQHCDYILRNNKRPYWGHAVSKDLINWKTCDTAISKDFWCMSGSGVVDERNVSGLFDESTDTKERIIAFYTAASNGVSVQMAAYSKDGGYTFTSLSKPIIAKVPTEGGWRDPKVVWINDSTHKNGGYYLMIIGGKYVHFYTSDNLLDWEYNSQLYYQNGDAALAECPDIFPLKAENEDRTLYIILLSQGYYGQGRNYLVGELKEKDGKIHYEALQSRIAINPAMCAAMQSYYNTPDGRRILQGWIPEQTAPESVQKSWNGMITMAVEASLKKDGDIYRMYLSPAKENYRAFSTALYEGKNITINSKSENPLKGISTDAALIKARIDLKNGYSATLTLRSNSKEKTVIHYDKLSKMLTVNTKNSGDGNDATNKTYSLPATLDENGVLTLEIFLDNTVVEVFANGGEAYITAVLFPPEDAKGMSLSAAGTVLIESIAVYDCNMR